MPNGWKPTAVLLISARAVPISLIGSGVWFHPWLSEVFPVNQLIEVTLIPVKQTQPLRRTVRAG